ncbi:MAG TPA: hypothetical protein VJ861_01045 [Treponemataceae bacterium]|nr:hypothetical protein [Treponemataceae bacterium]
MHELNEAEKKRLTSSILISLCMYSLFFVVLILAPLPAKKAKEPVYKAVSIRLTPPKEVPYKAEAVVAPVPAVSEPVAEVVQAKPAPAKTVSTPAKVSPAKVAQAKPLQAQAKTPSQKPATPPSQSQGLGIPNFDKPIVSSRENSSEAEFIDFSSKTPTTSPKRESLPQGGKPENELEGSLARVENASAHSQAVVVTSKTNKTASSSSATAETSSSLEKITESSIRPSSESAASASRSDVSKTSSVYSSIPELTFDGSPRRLIFPAKPEINLPDSLAALIDSDRTVTIQFTVRADGTVPSGLVIFTPSAIIPVSIRDYLRGEFSKWRFESGASDGQALFQYSIKVK